MRWPFRRRSATPPGPSTADGSGPERRTRTDTARRAWQSLPPLAPVIARPRLTMGPPPVSGIRPLLHRTPALRPADRPAGTVTGLAEVLPALEVAQPTPAPPTPRPVRAVARPTERPPLTAATAEYVGEAREPAQPHRAPAWLRALSSAPVVDPLLGTVLPAAPSFRPTPPSAAPAPVAAPRPMPTPRRPLRPRNRVGLGAPLRAEPGDPEPEPATAAPPAPAPAAAPIVPAAPAAARPGPAAPTPAIPTPIASHPPAGHAHQPAEGSPAPAAGEDAPARLSHRVAADEAAPADLSHRVAADEAAPADLSHEVAAAAGVDLDGVRIHRGPEVDRRAAESGAAAYTVDGAVHLPSAAGDGDEARALVAHELVHVAQQRGLGGALPDEDSPAGAELEAEAVAVEDAVRSGRPLPRLLHPRVVRARPAPIESDETRPAPPAALPVSRPDYRPAPASGTRTDIPARSAAPLSSREGTTARTGAPLSSREGTTARTAAPPSSREGTTARTAAPPSSPEDATTARPSSGGAPRVPDRTVPGRLQRRPTTLSHARPSPVSARTPATAASPPHLPAPPQTAQETRTTQSIPDSTPAAASSPPGFGERMSGFGEALRNDGVDFGLSIIGLEEVRQDDGPQYGSASPHRASRGRGRNRRNGGGGSEPSREERFNQLAQPALERLNQQRRDSGEPEFVALPPDEENRIWDQVDAGAGGNGTGPAPAPMPAIRSWSQFGAALGNDALDFAGSIIGLDAGPEDDATGPGPSAATRPVPSDATGPVPGGHAAGEHGRIDTDALDLDELTARIYDRIRSRIRQELLLDRERAGLLSDFR